MERIIHDLLDFIRPQKMMRRFVPVDRTGGRGRPNGSRVRFRRAPASSWSATCGPRPAVASCHPGEIQQVLQNLPVNAMQAQPDGGRVRVHTRALDGGMQVEVWIRARDLRRKSRSKLFTPFFTTKPTGSGLGLTICAQIIKAHGGVLRAENRPEGGARLSSSCRCREAAAR